MESGKGDDVDSIAFPDPRLCNLHLVISWIYAASGLAEVIDKILGV